MKNFFLICFFVAYKLPLIAQVMQDTAQQKLSGSEALKTEYLHKAKNQKTTATILFTSGLVLTTAGMIVWGNGFGDGWGESPDNAESMMNTGAVLMVTGVALTVSGIPSKIAGKTNEKKARLIVTAGNAMLTPRFSATKIYSAGIAIDL